MLVLVELSRWLRDVIVRAGHGSHGRDAPYPGLTRRRLQWRYVVVGQFVQIAGSLLILVPFGLAQLGRVGWQWGFPLLGVRGRL